MLIWLLTNNSFDYVANHEVEPEEDEAEHSKIKLTNEEVPLA